MQRHESSEQRPADRTRRRRTVQVVLALSTVLAAALRLPFLDHQSMWLDEIVTHQILAESSLSGVWSHIQATESTPPLYYLLGWLIHARGAAAMRLIPALSLIVAVPVAYLALRRLVGWRAALASASIVAVNPMLVAYATDARSYGLFVLTALLSVWAFSCLLEDASGRRFAIWVIASAACVWTHYFGAFLVIAQVAALLALRPRARLATVGWSCVLGACLAPLAWLVRSQAADGRAEFISGIPLHTRVVEAARQLSMGANVPRGWLEVAGVAIFCLACGAGIVIAARSGRGSRVLLWLTAVTLGASLLLAVLGIEDRFYARNLIAAVPLVGALAAPAMLRLRALPLAAYLALSVLASVWVATDWRYEQLDWRDAVARSQAIDPRAPIVALAYLNEPVVQSYLARRPVSAGVRTRRAWIIVQPSRGAGQRFLSEAPAPTLAGFATLRTLHVDGFRLVLVGSDRPTLVTPTGVAGGSLFPAARGGGRLR